MSMPRLSRRQWLASAAAGSFVNALGAHAASDVPASVSYTPTWQARHHLQWLADHADLPLTVSQWPLPAAAVQQALDQVVLPAQAAPERKDDLWKTTCFELFLGQAGTTYQEFNFSPSGQWVAYGFKDYRERDTGFTSPDAPKITMQALADGFQLEAELCPVLLPAGKSLQLGLSTVIEAADGSKSYWALAHCAAQPDFHLRQSFALTLNRNTP